MNGGGSVVLIGIGQKCFSFLYSLWSTRTFRISAKIFMCNVNARKIFPTTFDLEFTSANTSINSLSTSSPFTLHIVRLIWKQRFELHRRTANHKCPALDFYSYISQIASFSLLLTVLTVSRSLSLSFPLSLSLSLSP